jgi:hypothetical protein
LFPKPVKTVSTPYGHLGVSPQQRENMFRTTLENLTFAGTGRWDHDPDAVIWRNEGQDRVHQVRKMLVVPESHHA